MKVGIITFHWGDNYGAVFQAHALQSFLSGRGHEVEIINYCPKGRRLSLARRFLSKKPLLLARKLRDEAASALRHVLELPRRISFERFRGKRLRRTLDRLTSAEQVSALRDRYDVVLTGSDQVWNPEYLWFLRSFDAYLLGFAGNHTRRVSFAASFGLTTSEHLPAEWKDELAAGLSRMDAISVREASGVGLVRKLCGREDAVQVCDPTLLHDRHFFDSLTHGAREAEPGLFSYLLHGEEESARPILKALAPLFGGRMTRCHPQGKAFFPRGRGLSPEQWLGALKQSRFVVTNSFHATAFCLLFHTPFAVIPSQGRAQAMNNRMQELLAAVGLQDRMVSDAAGACTLASSPFPWAAVDERLAKMRENGSEFLSRQGL